MLDAVRSAPAVAFLALAACAGHRATATPAATATSTPTAAATAAVVIPVSGMT